MNNYQIPYYQEPATIDPSENFEEYASETFFPDHLYEMLHRTQDSRISKKRFVRSSLNPDFHFEIRNEPEKHFWVECKHLEIGEMHEAIRVFQREQLNRFKSFENSFLFLCVKIHREEYFFFVPFNQIKSEELYFSFLNSYIVSVDPPINPELIGKYLRVDRRVF
jgi:hypothetical protein